MSNASARVGRTVRLDSICRIVPGGRHKLSGKHFTEVGGYPAYGAGGHNGNLPSYEFDEPAIVLSAIGARCGKCFQPSGRWSSLANTAVFFPDANLADVRFLWYQLNDESSWHRSGTAQPYIRPSDIKARKVYLPSLAEQKRIAGTLDAADALRDKRREALVQLDTLLQSTFLDMFGDPITNPLGWDSSSLGNVGEVITGNTPSRKCPEYYGEGIEWIKSDNINDPSFVLTEAKEHLSDAGKAVARTCPRGSILVTCIAGSPSCIGNVAIADREVAFNQQINAFVPGKRIVLWFAFVLFYVGKLLVQSASTNSMKGMVSKSAFSGISIPIPPISIQNRFAAIAESIERQKVRQYSHLAELDTLFTSLHSRAFRGGL